MAHRNMTVGHLKRLLSNASEDALVVVPSVDHSYRSVDVNHTTLIVQDRGRSLTEDHGDQHISDPDNDYRVECVVIE